MVILHGYKPCINDINHFVIQLMHNVKYEGWNFISGNYLFTIDTK